MALDMSYILDAANIAVLLLISVVIKARVGFLKRYPIPVPIIAGFLGMLLGPEILGIISFESLRLENMVIQLMNIAFIALSLKTTSKLKNKEYVNSGMFIVSTYMIQGILGFGLSLLFYYTIFPDHCPLFGLLLPLGFGQGPGQAGNFGAQWEKLGFTHGGNLGLTVAALGYIWACVGGVFLTHYLVKVKKMKLQNKSADVSHPAETIFDEDKPTDLPMKESIDGLTLQLMLIGMVYLVTYYVLKLMQTGLAGMGNFGQTMANLLGGFFFILGAVIGMLVRKFLDGFFKKGIMKSYYTSNYLLERIAGGAFDFMITGAIAAISIKKLAGYFAPLMIITTLGGLITIWFIIKIGRRLYQEATLENILAMYGMLTGTISTGVALLREVDPRFQTQAAANLVLGSGTGLAFGVPLMVLLNIPIMGYTQNEPSYYFYTLAGFIIYLAVLVVLMYSNSKPGKIPSANRSE